MLRGREERGIGEGRGGIKSKRNIGEGKRPRTKEAWSWRENVRKVGREAENNRWIKTSGWVKQLEGGRSGESRSEKLEGRRKGTVKGMGGIKRSRTVGGDIEGNEKKKKRASGPCKR